MRFKIGKATYHTASADRLTLRQWMQIEQETTALGRPMTYTDVRAMVDRLGALEGNDEALDRDPDFLWFIALMIWASRTEAGEHITLADAVDFPLDDLEFIPDPQDKKDPRKPRAAKGSGRGGKRPAARPVALAAAATASTPESPSETPSSVA